MRLTAAREVCRGCRSSSHPNSHTQPTKDTAQTGSTTRTIVHSSKARRSSRSKWRLSARGMVFFFFWRARLRGLLNMSRHLEECQKTRKLNFLVLKVQEAQMDLDDGMTPWYGVGCIVPISLEVRRWAVRDFLGSSRSGCTVSESVQVDRSTTHIFLISGCEHFVAWFPVTEGLNFCGHEICSRADIASRFVRWCGRGAWHPANPFLGALVLFQQALTRACCAIAKSMLPLLGRRRCFELGHFRIRGCDRLALRHENSRI